MRRHAATEVTERAKEECEEHKQWAPSLESELASKSQILREVDEVRETNVGDIGDENETRQIETG